MNSPEHSSNNSPNLYPDDMSRNGDTTQELVEDSVEDPIERLVEGVNPNELKGEAFESLIDRHPTVEHKVSYLDYLRNNKQLTPEREKELVEDIKKQRNMVGSQLKARLGIVEEDPEARTKRLERERVVALAKIVATITHEETDDELLVKFGLIDENGKMTRESMNSPLFREDTKRNFNTYMQYAKQYDALEHAEAEQGIHLKNTAQASNLRTEAHDVVAKLVTRDLGLPFEIARRFVAKSRDAIVPGLHEKYNYAEFLRVQKLGERFSNDALAFTEESLRSIIAKPMDREINT